MKQRCDNDEQAVVPVMLLKKEYLMIGKEVVR